MIDLLDAELEDISSLAETTKVMLIYINLGCV